MGTEHSPELLFERVRSGLVDAAALQWLAAGFQKYDRDDGRLPLEVCLRLPSQRQRRRAQRDYYLLQAAQHVQGETAGKRAAALGAQIDAFMRGTWREWRHLADPPAGTTELRRNLHYLARLLNGQSRPSDKRIEQLLRAAASETREAQSFHGGPACLATSQPDPLESDHASDHHAVFAEQHT